MNTQDFLRQAQDALNQAVASAKTEVDEIRRALTARDQELHTRISELRRMEGNRLTEAANFDSSKLRALRENEAKSLRDQEAQFNQDYKQQKRELDNLVSLKQRGIDELTQIVGQLDRQIAQTVNPPNFTI